MKKFEPFTVCFSIERKEDLCELYAKINSSFETAKKLAEKIEGDVGNYVRSGIKEKNDKNENDPFGLVKPTVWDNPPKLWEILYDKINCELGTGITAESKRLR